MSQSGLEVVPSTLPSSETLTQNFGVQQLSQGGGLASSHGAQLSLLSVCGAGATTGEKS